MKEVLEKYEGITIGINCFDPIETDLLELFIVKDNYFGVIDRDSGDKSYFPYNAVMGIVEKSTLLHKNTILNYHY